jgi:hypothetical protein
VIVLGYALLGIALIWYLYRLYISFTSAGGTDFMLPVNDAVLYPPIMATLGLFLVLRNREIAWSFWYYAGIWLALAVTFWGTIRLAEELGDREL